jgi:hypothetical protein
VVQKARPGALAFSEFSTLPDDPVVTLARTFPDSLRPACDEGVGRYHHLFDASNPALSRQQRSAAAESIISTGKDACAA